MRVDMKCPWQEGEYAALKWERKSVFIDCRRTDGEVAKSEVVKVVKRSVARNRQTGDAAGFAPAPPVRSNDLHLHL
jgi:hypothetical protein